MCFMPLDRSIYSREEHIVMVSRDKIDLYETTLGDRNLFSNLAIGCIAGTVPVLVEKSIEYWNTQTIPGVWVTVLVCVLLGGVLFLFLRHSKSSKYEKVKADLFSNDKLIDKVRIITKDDGSQIQYSLLEKGQGSAHV